MNVNNHSKQSKTVDTSLLSPKEVALAIGASEASLKRWCDQGRIEFTRTAGGHRRIPVRGVIQFLRQTGQELIRPEILALPAETGRGAKALGDAQALFSNALEQGDHEQCRRVILNLYLTNRSAAEICDLVIAPAFQELGDRWQHGALHVYQERRAAEICMRLLYDLLALLPVISDAAPFAIGGTLEGDPYTLPTTMVEIALREAGLRASSYGTNLPVATLCAALQELRPQILWLSISHIASPDEFFEGYEQLYRTAAEMETAVLVGGRALTEAVRKRMSYSAFCDNLKHVTAYATSSLRAKD